MEEVFSGVFESGGKLFTKSLVPGTKVYGEKVLIENGQEFRQWDFFRSKLAAAVKNGLKEFPVRPGSNVLYLGAAEGTTVSHVSDIVGKEGLVFGVDVSERVMRKFIAVSEQRKNIVPILEDANRPWTYKDFLAGHKIDVLFQDVSQQNQAQIFLKNAEYFLEKGKAGMLVVKAKSISQTTDVGQVFGRELNSLSNSFSVSQVVNLKPFEKDHVLALCERI
jgi:fibrillarin-like pre-rRNA processing protein